MASKVSPFQELQIVVGQSNQVENRFALVPVKSGRVDVPMHKTMVVHVRDCRADLPEYEEKPGR